MVNVETVGAKAAGGMAVLLQQPAAGEAEVVHG